MSPKAGIYHDYDLMANREPTAQRNTCVTCGASPMSFQWSDYHGEAMCTACGTPYQLRAGSEEQEQEGAYPYLNMRDEWVPIVREYHAETGAFVYLGMRMGARPGMAEFVDWVRANHPSMLDDSEGGAS